MLSCGNLYSAVIQVIENPLRRSFNVKQSHCSSVFSIMLIYSNSNDDKDSIIIMFVKLLMRLECQTPKLSQRHGQLLR